MFANLKGVFTAIVALLLLCLAVLPVAFLAFLKLVLPRERKKAAVSRWLSMFAEFWLSCNRWCYRQIHRPTWLQDIPIPLTREQSYLVICNHQSWSDIPVLLFLLMGKVPFFRFLMKRVLVLLPVIGWGAWALDFPLLNRFSNAHLQKHPEDRGKDEKSLARLCKRLQEQPATIIIFAEGTRYSDEKRAAQRSSYKHLLNPKTGGVYALVSGLGEQLAACLDFTLIYENGISGFWQFLTGAIDVSVHVNQTPMLGGLSSTSGKEEAINREQTKQWLSSIWRDKDQLIANHSSVNCK